MKISNYTRFAIMLSASFIIMYIVMYLNVARFEHIYFSTTRLYMTILMVAPMAVVMMLVMKKMYEVKRLNTIITASAAVVFVLALVLLRTQTPISDQGWMKSMIPHHSIAILTSERADLQDPEVIELAREIIRTQEEEITRMKRLLEKIKD